MSNNKYTNLNTDLSIQNNITRFNGFHDNIYKDPFVGGNAFIFVTKPLLFIDPHKPSSLDNTRNLAFNNMTQDPFFLQYIKNENSNPLDEKIVKSLSYITDYSKSSFLPVFTNECRDFSPMSVNMDQQDFFETKQGFRQPLPTNKTMSEGSGTFDISVVEDSNLTFTKTISLWVNYISNITDGTFNANPEMVLNGTLDYTCSVYYFLLEPDGRSIKYWCRYTGCWPTSIPYDVFRYSRGQQDISELNINFQYTSKEDMNPKILEDFNRLSLKVVGEKIDAEDNTIKNSPLLNRNIMLRTKPDLRNILEATERDPIILFKQGSQGEVDYTKDTFELIFDDNGYKSVLSDILNEDDYFFNAYAENTAKYSDEGLSYNKTRYWNNNENPSSDTVERWS